MKVVVCQPLYCFDCGMNLFFKDAYKTVFHPSNPDCANSGKTFINPGFELPEQVSGSISNEPRGQDDGKQ